MLRAFGVPMACIFREWRSLVFSVYAVDVIVGRFMNIFISTWGLLVAGLLFAAPMIHLRVKDYTDLEDETLYVYLHLFGVSLPSDTLFVI